MIKKTFKYIEPLWLGTDSKISLKNSGAIALIIDFISNMSHAVYKWEASRSLEGLSLILGIEASMIVALLGVGAWSNVMHRRISSEYPSTDPDVPRVEVPD